MADLEKMEANLKRLEEKQKAIQARRERQLARFNAEKGKQRTKRLIEKGAILEDLQAVAKGLKKVPQAPRVSKAEDSEGYARYQAYRQFTQEKERLSETISPEDSLNWLNELVAFSQWASGFTFSNEDGSHEKAYDRFRRLKNQRS